MKSWVFYPLGYNLIINIIITHYHKYQKSKLKYIHIYFIWAYLYIHIFIYINLYIYIYIFKLVFRLDSVLSWRIWELLTLAKPKPSSSYCTIRTNLAKVFLDHVLYFYVDNNVHRILLRLTNLTVKFNQKKRPAFLINMLTFLVVQWSFSYTFRISQGWVHKKHNVMGVCNPRIKCQKILLWKYGMLINICWMCIYIYIYM